MRLWKPVAIKKVSVEGKEPQKNTREREGERERNRNSKE